jgi:hypothetical protein
MASTDKQFMAIINPESVTQDPKSKSAEMLEHRKTKILRGTNTPVLEEVRKQFNLQKDKEENGPLIDAPAAPGANLRAIPRGKIISVG